MIRTNVVNVNIGAVTAEILPIWTNVAVFNVAGTNVTATVQCISVKDGPRKLTLKYGQIGSKIAEILQQMLCVQMYL